MIHHSKQSTPWQCAHISGQMTSNFLTQASWRLHEVNNVQLDCAQHPTSLKIRPLRAGHLGSHDSNDSHDRQEKTLTDLTDWKKNLADMTD